MHQIYLFFKVNLRLSYLSFTSFPLIIIIHVSVHFGLSSIIIISHVWYASIIIIIDIHLVIFHGGAWTVLGSKTINDNSIPPSRYRRANPSNKQIVIVASSLWLAFSDKIRGGGSVANVDPVRRGVLLSCYRLPSFLETRTDWNSTSLSFRQRNHFLVWRNLFSNITQLFSSITLSFSADVSNFDLFSIY